MQLGGAWCSHTISAGCFQPHSPSSPVPPPEPWHLLLTPPDAESLGNGPTVAPTTRMRAPSPSSPIHLNTPATWADSFFCSPLKNDCLQTPATSSHLPFWQEGKRLSRHRCQRCCSFCLLQSIVSYFTRDSPWPKAACHPNGKSLQEKKQVLQFKANTSFREEHNSSSSARNKAQSLGCKGSFSDHNSSLFLAMNMSPTNGFWQNVAWTPCYTFTKITMLLFGKAFNWLLDYF